MGSSHSKCLEVMEIRDQQDRNLDEEQIEGRSLPSARYNFGSR